MKILRDEPILSGDRFDVHRLTIRGNDGRDYDREFLRHPGAVVLLPVLDDGRLVMIDNYRVSVDDTLLELPAGTRDRDEPPLTTARRELIEETGYDAATFDPVHEFYSAPGISDERMWLYRATGLTEVGADREAVEDIANRIVTADDARRLIADGTIRDGKTLVGLYAWLAAGASA